LILIFFAHKRLLEQIVQNMSVKKSCDFKKGTERVHIADSSRLAEHAIQLLNVMEVI
tara:strand:- start:1362 stop:1532 length:171 start_codon:yes stop_codon:yes gene_type:complete